MLTVPPIVISDFSFLKASCQLHIPLYEEVVLCYLSRVTDKNAFRMRMVRTGQKLVIVIIITAQLQVQEF